MHDAMTDDDMLFDLDLRVVTEDAPAEHEWGSIHTTYITELCGPSEWVC